MVYKNLRWLKFNRKQRIQWPLADDKGESLVKILKNTLIEEIHKKLSAMLTIVYVEGQERLEQLRPRRTKKEASPVNNTLAKKEL